jgi:hypothetical protein
MNEDDDDDNEEKIIPNIRERALSECVRPSSRRRRRSASALTLNRLHLAHSDSNLSYIDKEKTFNLQKAAVQPGELLAKVVVALGGYRGNIEDGEMVERMRQSSIYSNSTMGIHGFSDSQILASEQNYNSSEWSIAASERSFNPYSNRMRAASVDIKIPIDEVKVKKIYENKYTFVVNTR